MSDAERARRYRARLRGEPVPFGQPGRLGADHPTEVLRSLGLDLGDPQRSEDLIAADRTRERAARDETHRRLLELASGVRKARRAADLAFADWKARATAENLRAVDDANRNRSAIEAELRERCAGDEALVAEVKRAAGW
jgi:hypothetical protein